MLLSLTAAQTAALSPPTTSTALGEGTLDQLTIGSLTPVTVRAIKGASRARCRGMSAAPSLVATADCPTAAPGPRPGGRPFNTHQETT